MAIRIDGTPRFRERVIAALGEICPCFEYTLAADGGVTARPRLPRDLFCDCYCDRRAGCNLLDDLINDRNSVTISSTQSGSRYDTNTRDLRWNPNNRPQVRTVQGRRATPASLVLGHELVHAQHHNAGTLADGETNGQSNEEINASRGENQLRAERRPPVPPRTHHGGLPVPNPQQPDLDDRDRQNCGCGLIDRILRAIRRFFARLFKLFRNLFGRREREEREERGE